MIDLLIVHLILPIFFKLVLAIRWVIAGIDTGQLSRCHSLARRFIFVKDRPVFGAQEGRLADLTCLTIRFLFFLFLEIYQPMLLSIF